MIIEKLNWSSELDQFLNYLYSLSDSKYREFSKSLVPGNAKMIGIRIPVLKKIAKEIMKGDYQAFLEIESDLFEMTMLKGLVIANIKDVNEYKRYFNSFISSIDNWSICDTFIMASKVIKKDMANFYKTSCDLIKMDKEFYNRVGFVILLDYFVIDVYIDSIFDVIDGYRSDMYYANMALAWLISICYIKYPLKTWNFLNRCSLSKDVINMSVRKIKDSYRVGDEDKNKLKKLVNLS